jgi:TatD DNase family protein
MRPHLPLDLHAHVDPRIPPRDLVDLRAAVFAVTRSLDEASAALARADTRTCWGVGCHPGLVRAQKAFGLDRFAELVARAAFVSEVGLDGESRVPMALQQATLDAILRSLQSSPRITSLHSFQASEQVVTALESRPIVGAVLHWWLGDAQQTVRALDLGCFFSINASSVRRSDLLELIPLDRVLTETDHPFGDRRTTRHARPGVVDPVEEALARHHGVPVEEIRSKMWSNLARLVEQAGCIALLPRSIRLELIAS